MFCAPCTRELSCSCGASTTKPGHAKLMKDQQVRREWFVANAYCLALQLLQAFLERCSPEI